MAKKVKSIVPKQKTKLFQNVSIKVKALIPTIFTILFFGSIATIFVYRQTVNNLLTVEKRKISLIAEKQAKETVKFFRMGTFVVDSISSHPDVINYSSDKSQQDPETLELLKNYNLGDSFLSIYIMDKSGVTLVSTDPAFVGNNYGYRKYFKDGLEKSGGIDIAVGATSGELGYYFSSPVVVDGEVEMVVVAKMKPERINCTITNQEQGTIVFDTFLADELGVIICGTDDEKLFKSLGSLNPEQRKNLEDWKRYPDKIESLSYEEAQISLKDADKVKVFEVYDEKDGKDEIIFLKSLELAPFFVFIELEVSDVITSARVLSLEIGLVVIAAAISALFLVSFVLSKVLKPITSLTEEAEDIANGDYERRFTKITTNDEFGLLRKSFEKMRDELLRSRDVLEEKVKQQTEELDKQKDALLNVLEDVDEEKKVAQKAAQDLTKFKMATDSVAEQIVITDSEGRIIYANPATEKITGYSIDEIIGKKAGSKDLWGGNMPDEFYKEMWDTIKNKKKPFKGEIKNTRRGGQDYIASAIIAPVLNERGEVVFFVGTEEDITKRKEVDRMKTEFISLASHQLRTPLSAMKWFLEMLLGGDVGKLNKEQKEYVTNINDSNERMISLVSSLLNVSRIESGRIIIDPKPTKLRDLVEQVVTELQPKLEEKDMAFVFSASDNIPEINIDPKLIRNVYQNLLTNAVKYTPEGGEVTVIISKEKDKVISQVSDNGYGIPEDSKAEIFDKFFRASNIVSKDPEGSGLGLYLVKAIVETSGGEVWFESKEDEGTTFWFSLPMEGSKAKEGVVSIDS